MTVFQLLMLGASTYFAFKIYEHIQTLQEPQKDTNQNVTNEGDKTQETFSPFSPEALLEKADTAVEEQDYTKAHAFLVEANAKDNHNKEILFKLGYVSQKLDDNEEAIKYYKEALEVDKNNEYTHNSMASIYRANGEFISAKLHLKASLDINDENPITYYNYGNLLVDMGHEEEAIDMYAKAYELDNEFEEAKTELEQLKKKHG